MTQDERSLNLLAIFHYIVGGMTALFACIPLIHLAMGVAMLCGAFDGGGAEGPLCEAYGSDGPEASLIGWFFILVAGTFILAGWVLAFLIVIAGRKLKRRCSRTYCLVVAGLECMLMPWGTVLGVFTIVVLMKESVKELFPASQGS